MKAKLARMRIYGAIVAGWLLGIGGCTTTEVTPPPAPAVPPPPYVQVPHPTGTDLVDLRALFADKSAPTRDSIKDCEADYDKLLVATKSNDERHEGTKELVRHDPVKYHWCFYSRILDLEDAIKKENYVDERQKKILSTYAFLVPIARGFMGEYHDSRYLRWAVAHYRRLSEYLFSRRLELTPQETSELVQVSNPFGLWRENVEADSVLQKYGIARNTVPMAVPSAQPEAPVDPQQSAKSDIKGDNSPPRDPAADGAPLPSIEDPSFEPTPSN